jgi:diguanylate cyclase (GGDEF)-like protein
MLLIDHGAFEPRLFDQSLLRAVSGYGLTLQVERLESALDARTRELLDDVDVVVCDTLSAQRLQSLARPVLEVPLVLLERPAIDGTLLAANGLGIVDRLDAGRIEARDLARAICLAFLRRRVDAPLGGEGLGQAYCDDLTGVRSQRFLQELIRHNELGDWGCVLIGLEGLRSIASATGIKRRREIVRGMADFLRGHVRESDIVVRSGEDEFLLLLPDAAAGSTPALAGRLRHAMVYAPCAFSLGMAVRAGGEVLQQTLERAAAQLRESHLPQVAVAP